jgi:hypothetical protein
MNDINATILSHLVSVSVDISTAWIILDARWLTSAEQPIGTSHPHPPVPP